jgi:hypothetical protein
MGIYMFYLMLVKFSEFPVKDEEKSDRILKNLFGEYEAHMTRMLERWRRSLSTGKLENLYLNFCSTEKGDSMYGHKFGYSTP